MNVEGSYVTKWKDVVRWLIHLPIGIVIAFLIMRVDVAMGIVVAVYFLAYEALEDWRIGDRSFKDVFGSLIAMVTTALVLYLWF